MQQDKIFYYNNILLIIRIIISKLLFEKLDEN